jgi:hypothetical protein
VQQGEGSCPGPPTWLPCTPWRCLSENCVPQLLGRLLLLCAPCGRSGHTRVHTHRLCTRPCWSRATRFPHHVSTLQYLSFLQLSSPCALATIHSYTDIPQCPRPLLAPHDQPPSAPPDPPTQPVDYQFVDKSAACSGALYCSWGRGRDGHCVGVSRWRSP